MKATDSVAPGHIGDTVMVMDYATHTWTSQIT